MHYKIQQTLEAKLQRTEPSSTASTYTSSTRMENTAAKMKKLLTDHLPSKTKPRSFGWEIFH